MAFILVFFIAFGMGRLSVLTKNIESIEIEDRGEVVEKIEEINQEKGIFVGSRNSDKYHFPDCSWAEKIKPENQIWFKSEQDAESHGYTASKCVTDRK